MNDINDVLPEIDEKINLAGKALLITDPSQLKSCLSKQKKTITVATQNIRSVNANFSDFEILLSWFDADLDIIVLSECWLQSCPFIPILPNYTCCKTTKVINQNSGVVLYIKDSLQRIRVSEPEIDGANCLVVEIGNHTAFVCIYRPPSQSIDAFLVTLDKLLNKLKTPQNLFLIGDVNIDLKSRNVEVKSPDYLTLMATHSLMPAHLIPTQFGNCIDHCFAKTRESITTVVCESTITDHYTAINNISHKFIKNIQIILSK